MAKSTACPACQRLARRLSRLLARHFRASKADAEAAGKSASAILKAIEDHWLRTGHDAFRVRLRRPVPAKT